MDVLMTGSTRRARWMRREGGREGGRGGREGGGGGDVADFNVGEGGREGGRGGGREGWLETYRPL